LQKKIGDMTAGVSGCSIKSKPLYFQQNKHLFKSLSEEIIHIIIGEYPDLRMRRRMKMEG